MFSINYLDNQLHEGVLISNFKTSQQATKALENLAKKWDLVFKSDDSLFGGYYVRKDGVCYFVR